MRRIVWSEEARENLEAIQAYVAEFNASAARRLALRLVDLIDSLATHSERGRQIRPGVRELTSIPPYVIRYVVAPDEVWIMGIRHAARRPEG